MMNEVVLEHGLPDAAAERPWAEQEFGAAELGDARRTARLVQLASAVGAQPTASIPEATGSAAAAKAAYRFFDTAACTPAALLASHVAATRARLAQVPLVLAVQDTTLLDWTHHPATTGLGPLATPQQQGLVAHSTLALTPERVPLGLVAQQVWARDAQTYGSAEDHKTRPIADKESHKWLTSLAAVIEAHRACPQTHFVSVGDAEADVYDLFVAPRPAGVDLLVRAAQDRRVRDADQPHLWAALAAAPHHLTLQVQVPRQGPQQPARTATLTVRWRALTLRPPKHRAQEGLASVPLWAVWAVEAQPPPGVEPIHWLLLTTVAVPDAAAAQERLAWYCCRWGIEVLHKVLKSGCRLEARQFATAERRKRCLAVYSVIAWRILYATLLARALPDAPCTALLEAAEWQALYCTIQRTTVLPPTVPTLRQAVRWLARLGGFLERTGDGEPGVTVLWRGFQHLTDLTTMYRLFRPTQDVGKV